MDIVRGVGAEKKEALHPGFWRRRGRTETRVEVPTPPTSPREKKIHDLLGFLFMISISSDVQETGPGQIIRILPNDPQEGKKK